MKPGVASWETGRWSSSAKLEGPPDWRRYSAAAAIAAPIAPAEVPPMPASRNSRPSAISTPP